MWTYELPHSHTIAGQIAIADMSSKYVKRVRKLLIAFGIDAHVSNT